MALAAAVVALGLGYGALLAPRDPSGPLAQFLDSAVATVVLVGLAAGLAFATSRGRLGARALGPILVTLVVFDLFSATAPVPPTNDDPLAGFRHDDAAAIIRAAAPDGPVRVEQSKLVESGWQPPWAATAGLESVSGTYDPLGLTTYARYWDATRQRHDSPRYDLLGIRYVLLPPNDSPAGGAKFREVGRGKDFVIYENTTVLPRAFLVGGAQPVVTTEDAWTAINTQGFDPRATAYLGTPADGTDPPPALNAGAPQGQATVIRPDGDELRATVESDRDAILVFGEVAYPGWRATIDGAATPLYTADYLFRAVRVPAGRHDVRLTFTPPLWRLGWFIAGGSALIVAVLPIAPPLLRRRRPKVSAGPRRGG